MPARKLGTLNLPALSVLVSCFAPWSLTERMPTSAQGFPLTSRIVPLIEPVWAAARGASTLASAAIRMAASVHDLRNRFMLHSPFSRGAQPGVSRLCAPHYLSQARRFQAQRPAETGRRSGMGSGTPAATKARNRSRQLSHAPQAVSSFWQHDQVR